MAIRLTIAQAEKEHATAQAPLSAAQAEIDQAQTRLRDLRDKALSPDQQTEIVGLERFVKAKQAELVPLQARANEKAQAVLGLQTQLRQAQQRRDLAKTALDSAALPGNMGKVDAMIKALIAEMQQATWGGLLGDAQAIKDAIDTQLREHRRLSGDYNRWVDATAPLPELKDGETLPDLPQADAPKFSRQGFRRVLIPGYG